MSLRRAAARLAPQLARSMLSEASACPSAAALLCRAQAPGSPMAQAIRGFRASAATPTALNDTLRSEIEYEKQNYTQPEELAVGPPAPFTLTETRGDTLMTLTRSYGAGETVTVDVMVNEQPEEEPFESEEGVLDVDVGVVFTAAVTRGDTSLVFECKSDGSYLQILHVGVEPAETAAAGTNVDSDEYDESAYNGPVFEELDDEVQRQFGVFLEERGVDAGLGGYLLRLVHDKEQREYMYWLQRVADFVKG